MSKPLVVFPDAMLATLEILRAAFPAHSESEDATAGTKVPKDFSTGEWPLPYVSVRLATGSSGLYPVTETTPVRVIVWDTSEAKTLALAQLLRGILLSYVGGDDVRSYGSLIGINPAADPDTGDPLASFTVAARLRPTPL